MRILKAILAIIVCQLAGIIGTVFTTPAIPTWYAGLVKPALNPPSWVFGPVWTLLYALMGIAAFIIWEKGFGRKDVKVALGLFALQLALNAIWSPIFFGLQNPGLALIVIAFMWIAIVFTIISFSRLSKIAAWLLVPYLAWVSFASYLNASIWMLN